MIFVQINISETNVMFESNVSCFYIVSNIMWEQDGHTLKHTPRMTHLVVEYNNTSGIHISQDTILQVNNCAIECIYTPKNCLYKGRKMQCS